MKGFYFVVAVAVVVVVVVVAAVVVSKQFTVRDMRVLHKITRRRISRKLYEIFPKFQSTFSNVILYYVAENSLRKD